MEYFLLMNLTILNSFIFLTILELHTFVALFVVFFLLSASYNKTKLSFSVFPAFVTVYISAKSPYGIHILKSITSTFMLSFIRIIFGFTVIQIPVFNIHLPPRNFPTCRLFQELPILLWIFHHSRFTPWPQNTIQKSMIRHDSSLSKYSKQKKQSPPGNIQNGTCPGGDCFCLWRIALTQKTMEMDFCIIFCGHGNKLQYG